MGFTATEIIDLVIGAVILVCLLLLLHSITKKISFLIVPIIIYVGIVFGHHYELHVTNEILIISSILYFSFILSMYSGSISKIFKKLKNNDSKSSSFNSEIGELSEIINTSVSYLSKNKIGALMVFQKNDDLQDFINAGRTLVAKANSDLICSIFYQGTALHDGALIFDGLEIKAASVYFVPTTKPMRGKFGARHRAAMGFSENHDSVVVVVSEETGRISFAIEGQIVPVKLDEFKNRFEEYLKA